MAARSHLSIGEVLSLLREEFPDITISKIRFLESQGLVDPERTPSGYRKFYEHDVERLRWILHQQRENFLPLKVIRGRLYGAEGEAGEAGPGGPDETPVSPGDAGALSPAPEAAPQAPAPTAREAVTAPPVADGRPSGAAGSQADRAPSTKGDGGAPPAQGAGQGRPAPASPRSAPATPAGEDRAEQAPAVKPGQPAAATPPPAVAGKPAPQPAAAVAGPDRPDPKGSGAAGEATGRPPAAAPGAAGARPAPGGAPAQPGPRQPAAGAQQPATGSRPSGAGPQRPAGSPKGADGDRAGEGDVDSFTAAELASAAGIDRSEVAGLEQFGLLTPRSGAGGAAYFDADAVEIARIAAAFARHGVEARHLRAWKTSAEREASLFEQVIMPLLRQRNPQARRQALETLDELAGHGGRLRELLVRRALRDLH